MASLNTVLLMGNLTRDPELRYTPQGTAVASFGLAVNRRYRQDDQQREEVCFVDIVTFGRQAETTSEYLSKGDLAMIEGRLQWRSWETPEGQKRSKHEVIANNVQFMPRGSAGSSGEVPPPQASRSAPPNRPRTYPQSAPMREDGEGLDTPVPPPQDDDIPF
ncbi:MAG: single-stranded DNA-binding protein [Candidatus Tectomicrobia bacterium]|nr:single-stranded DNA-binding protein [Candidatus Tectomicrobia bacterium]